MLFLALLVVCCILVSAMGFVPWSARSTRSYRMGWFGSDGKDGSDFKEADVKSKEIERLMAKIETTQNEIISTISQREKDEATLKELDSEFGEEIARVKKEFARMKERTRRQLSELAVTGRPVNLGSSKSSWLRSGSGSSLICSTFTRPRHIFCEVATAPRL